MTGLSAPDSAVEIEKPHAKIGELLVERLFCARPPADERRPDAGDDRPEASCAVDGAAIRASVDPLVARRRRQRVGADHEDGRSLPTDAERLEAPDLPEADRAVLSLRPERHVPTSIATLRITIARMPARTLQRCPCRH